MQRHHIEAVFLQELAFAAVDEFHVGVATATLRTPSARRAATTAPEAARAGAPARSRMSATISDMGHMNDPDVQP